MDDVDSRDFVPTIEYLLWKKYDIEVDGVSNHMTLIIRSKFKQVSIFISLTYLVFFSERSKL